MIVFLWVLLAAGVALTAFAFLPAFSQDKKKLKGNEYFQNRMISLLKDLKDEIHFLRHESKQASQIHSVTHSQLQKLTKKELSVETPHSAGFTIKEKEVHDTQDEIYQLRRDSHTLREEIKQLLVLAEKNKQLQDEIIELNSIMKKLHETRKKQDNVISELRNNEECMQKELTDTRISFQALRSELNELKKSELKLKNDLFKQKAICADAEKELEFIKEENEELKDGLAYELNN